MCLLLQGVIPVFAHNPYNPNSVNPGLFLNEDFEDNGLPPALPFDIPQTGEPPLSLPAQANNLSELFPPDLAILAVQNVNQTIQGATTGPDGGVASFMNNRLTLIIDQETFTDTVQLTVTALEAPVQPVSGELFRFHLQATRLSTGSIVEQFAKPLHIVVDNRAASGNPVGGKWYIGWQADDQPGIIHYPTVQVHDPAGLFSVATSHFSIYIAGNESEEPAAWQYRWNPPVVSAFSGAATYQYPVSLPPGRAGLTPNIDFAYSSASLNSLVHSGGQDQGPIGLGWSMNNIEISRDNIASSDNGANIEWHHGPQFSLVLDGASHELQLTAILTNTIPQQAFYTAQNAPGLFIQQIYDPNASGINSDKIYWIVKTPTGVTYRLGYNEDAETGQQVAFLLYTDGTQLTGAQEDYGGIRWRVDTVTDPSGNQIQYDYLKWEESEDYIHPSQPYTTTVNTTLSRPVEIRYNFVNLATSPLQRVSGSYGSKISFENTSQPPHRLEAIRLYHVDLNTPYRVINLTLDTISHDQDPPNNDADCHPYTPVETEIVTAIREENSDGSLYLPATTFSYLPLSHNYNNLTCYVFEHLEQVANGYGAKVRFTYTADGRSYFPNFPNGSDYPYVGQSFYVTQVETWDRTWDSTASPAITEYSYESPCYDEIESNNYSDCISRPVYNYPVYGYSPGPLVGFMTTTMTIKEYGGQTILGRQISQFEQLRPRQGWAVRQQTVDANNGNFMLQEQETLYANDGDNFHYAASVINRQFLAGGQTNEYRQDYTYDRQNGVQYGNVTHIYDWGLVSLSGDEKHIRRGYYPNLTNWLVGQVAWEVLSNNNDQVEAESLNYYDNQSCFECSPLNNGRLTRVDRLSSLTNLTFVTTQSQQYDVFGNVTHSWDGQNNLTQIVYDPTYRLMPISITNALTHVQTFAYYGFNGVAIPANRPAGLLTSLLDANNQTTTYEYDDFGRLQKVFRPGDPTDSPSEAYYYYDYGSLRLTSGPLLIGKWQKTQNNATIFSTGGLWERQFFNGLGQQIQSQTPYTNWLGSGVGQQVQADTGYDSAGNSRWQSIPYLQPAYVYGTTGGLINNPYVPADPNQNRQFTSYDSTNQPVRAIGFDGVTTSLVYGRATTYSQDGNNHLQANFFNADGQLAAVDEMLSTETDGFDNANLPGWTKSGNVTVSGSNAHLTGNGATIYRPLPAATTDKGTTISFKVTNSNHQADLYLYYPGGTNQRLWGLAIRNGRLQQVERIGTGSPTYTDLLPVQANTWYRLYLRQSSSNQRYFSLVVWQDDQPQNRAEIRLPRNDSYWSQSSWNFRAQSYNSTGSLDLDNYDGLDINRTLYNYDPAGNLIQVIDPLGHQTTMTYDDMGRKTNMSDPDMGSWSYGYDNNGNLIRQTDANNQTICFAYDALNRLTSKQEGNGLNCPANGTLIATYTYDNGLYGKGQRTGMTAYDNGLVSNSATWVYDQRQRVSQEQRLIGTASFSFNFTYSQGNLPLTMQYPDGEVVTTQYYWQTGAARSLSGTAWYVGTNSEQDGATYTPAGQLATLTLGNSKVTTYTYDAAFRLNTMVNDSGQQNLDYDYDPAGNITRLTDSAMAGGTQTQRFSYDALGRLTTACTLNGSGNCHTNTSYGRYNHQYSYDVMGNLQSKTAGGTLVNLDYNLSRPHALSHWNGSQRYTYDNNGNMLTRNDGTTTWNYTWTKENRLRQAAGGSTTVTFTYDGDGQLARRTDQTGQITHLLGHFYQATTYAATETSQTTSHYLFNGQLVAQRVGSNYHYFLTDHLGSTTTTLYPNGQLEATLRYDPWGNTRYSQNATPTGYRYTSQRQDSPLGLYDYHARYYDPVISRFLSPDSIVPGPSNPQTFNRYTYVLNNPILNIDPTGHISCTELGTEECDENGDFVDQDPITPPDEEIPTSLLGVIPPWWTSDQIAQFKNKTLPRRTLIEIAQYGDFLHIYVQLWFIEQIRPTAQKEVYIRYAGYADLVDMATGEIWEVKPSSIYGNGGLASALLQLNTYVRNLPGSRVGGIIPQLTGSGLILQHPLFPATKELVIQMRVEGIITYYERNRTNNPVYVPAFAYSPAGALANQLLLLLGAGLIGYGLLGAGGGAGQRGLVY